MKIEVGMYVRTNLGNIGKIVEEYTHQNHKVSYPEPQEWVLDTGYILNEALMYNNEEITKASYNIIDLIEVGDYVNVLKVHGITDFGLQVYMFGDCPETLDNNEIETIVTKEQFSSMEYKINE